MQWFPNFFGEVTSPLFFYIFENSSVNNEKLNVLFINQKSMKYSEISSKTLKKIFEPNGTLNKITSTSRRLKIYLIQFYEFFFETISWLATTRFANYVLLHNLRVTNFFIWRLIYRTERACLIPGTYRCPIYESSHKKFWNSEIGLL